MTEEELARANEIKRQIKELDKITRHLINERFPKLKISKFKFSISRDLFKRTYDLFELEDGALEVLEKYYYEKWNKLDEELRNL